MSDEVEEDPNEGVLDCHTCYHGLDLHRNGVGCGAQADACSVENCCPHSFPPVYNAVCDNCGERQQRLSKCGRYHPEGVACELCQVCQTLKSDDVDKLLRAGADKGGVNTAAIARLQLVVTHNNENVTYYPVGDDVPWKIDAGLQLLVVGKGIGRMMVPLCNIMYFTLQQY